MKKGISILTLLLVFIQGFGQIQLDVPVAGSYLEDFIIVNYVDWGLGADVTDHQCGSKSYDGHQGTDFVIRSFKAMDEGVLVLAAQAGTVTFVQDGLFDRETTGDVAKKLGNYIAIAHDNKYYTYYGHLKKGSIQVKVGDKVKSGDIIGQVGSSGNSTDPHLHFELWYDSSIVVDPFKGICGNPTSSWSNELKYDTSVGLWTSGLTSKQIGINDVRNEPLNVTTFSQPDTIITYWNIMKGVTKDDKVNITWLDPNDDVWFSNTFESTQDYWYFLYWNYINFPESGMPGTWKVIIDVNGVEVDEKSFTVNNINAVQPKTATNDFKVRQYEDYVLISSNHSWERWELVNPRGQTVWRSNQGSSVIVPKTNLVNGYYYLRAISGKHLDYVKIPILLK